MALISKYNCDNAQSKKSGLPKMGLAEIRPILALGQPLERGCVVHDLIYCVRRTDILNIDFEKPFSNKFDRRPSQ